MDAFEELEVEIRQTDLCIKNETSESVKLALIKGRNLLIKERLFLRQLKGNF